MRVLGLQAIYPFTSLAIFFFQTLNFLMGCLIRVRMLRALFFKYWQLLRLFFQSGLYSEKRGRNSRLEIMNLRVKIDRLCGLMKKRKGVYMCVYVRGWKFVCVCVRVSLPVCFNVSSSFASSSFLDSRRPWNSTASRSSTRNCCSTKNKKWDKDSFFRSEEEQGKGWRERKNSFNRQQGKKKNWKKKLKWKTDRS